MRLSADLKLSWFRPASIWLRSPRTPARCLLCSAAWCAPGHPRRRRHCRRGVAGPAASLIACRRARARLARPRARGSRRRAWPRRARRARGQSPAPGIRPRFPDGGRAAQPAAAATGLRLAATLLFDHPTPAALSRFLAAQLLGRAAEHSSVAAPRLPVGEDEPIAIVAMSCRFPGGVRTPEDSVEPAG